MMFRDISALGDNVSSDLFHGFRSSRLSIGLVECYEALLGDSVIC
jgi:hypothetical protein